MAKCGRLNHAPDERSDRMAHVIEIPDDLYEKLAGYAKQHQQTLEELFLSWARQMTTAQSARTWGNEPPPTEEELRNSPLLRIAGSLPIGDPRLQTEFDEVLAEAIADDHADGK
jgi:hypothetical protein